MGGSGGLVWVHLLGVGTYGQIWEYAFFDAAF
jgi:hypothetical protein